MSEKTLADYPDLMFAHRAHRGPHAVFDSNRPMTSVVAPCCGRITAAATVLDVRHIPGTRVRGGGHRPEQDHDWLCDACRDRMIRDPGNPWTRSALLEKAGAPEAVVLHHRTRERVHEMERDDHANNRPHKPAEAWAIAHAAVLREHQSRGNPK